MRGAAEVDPRTRGDWGWRIQNLPLIAPRPIKPVGGPIDVQVYSVACAGEAGVAAATLFEDDFAVE